MGATLLGVHVDEQRRPACGSPHTAFLDLQDRPKGSTAVLDHVRAEVHPQLLASLVLQVPDPQFPTKTPAGRRSSPPVRYPAPGGQPVPHHPHEASSVEHQPQQARLPVRSSGQHLHPQLRRLPWAGTSDKAGGDA
ncbi:MAG: hypothetical protein ACRDTA_09915 [Pseudonocardiaceae bacterium]